MHHRAVGWVRLLRPARLSKKPAGRSERSLRSCPSPVRIGASGGTHLSDWPDMQGAQFTVALEGGRQVTGSFVDGAVECRGQVMDARDIIALDRRTLFLFGPVQVDVAEQLKGFLELEVAGVGPMKLPLDR